MIKTIFLSAECPGLALGFHRCSGQDLNFKLLPDGQSLADRVSLCSVEDRESAIAIVCLLTDVVDAEQLKSLQNQLPRLQLLANYAVGFNNIDWAAARECGVAVTNTPHVLGDATADLTLTLMLMVARRIWTGALELYEHGRFAGWSPHYGLGVDLNGRTLGIVGLGDIGRRVALRAQALGMRTVALRSFRASDAVESDIPRLSEDEFLFATDVLSLHCPLTHQTRGWLNAERLAKLKKGSMVINTARGDVVDEFALATALRSGHLFGAGLDVFCGEPVLSSALRGAPNLVVLPHLGSATVETRTAMGQRVMENIVSLIERRSPLPTQVNP